LDKTSCVERFLNVSRATLSWDSTQQRKHPLWKVVNFNEVRICITTGCPQSLGIYGFSLSMWKCGLWKAHVLGPFFFDEHVTGETYLIMLRDKLMPQIEHLGEGLPDWFHQDGAPAYFAKAVRDWLNDNFPHWIGRRGHVEWNARSPDLSPIDFFFWGMLKEKVYLMKIIDLNYMREGITSQCAEINGNAHLFHRVHQNFAKRIQLCTENDGNYVKNIIYQHYNWIELLCFKKHVFLYHGPRLFRHPVLVTGQSWDYADTTIST